MKYIAQPDGTFAAIDETTELFAQLSACPGTIVNSRLFISYIE